MTSLFKDDILNIVCLDLQGGCIMASKAGRKKGSRQKNKKKQEQNFVLNEIIIWVTLAVSIFLLISNFGFGGFLGAGIADFMMDIFGAGAYIVPFLLFVAVAFIISNKGNMTAYIKTFVSGILFVLICTLFELIHEAGGRLGCVLADLLIPAVGIVGTYVIVLILMIICVVVITGKSLLKVMDDSGRKAYSKVKEDAKKRHEHAKEQKEQEKSAKVSGRTSRRKNRVEGVSFDTTLSKKSPDMRELKPEGEAMTQDVPKEPQFIINRAGADEPEFPEPEAVEAVSESARLENEAEERPRRKGKLSTEVMAAEVADVENAVAAADSKPKKAYKIPPLSLLTRGKKGGGDSDAHLRETAMKLQQTLQNFGVNVTITNVSCGPSVTRYELQPEQGVKVSKIVGLTDDIKLNLAAADIRIEAPIPGKAAVGIEVPNKENSTVMLRNLLETEEFKNSKSKISFAAGRDIAGKVVVADIAKMPHLLVAGATGSGKSVCINTLIMSILYKASPEEVKLLMIDPKVVELSVYNGIPHLMIPVVTDPKKAAGALNWAVSEMTKRYQLFAEYNVRDMKGYNDKIAQLPVEEGKELPQKMPQIVIIVDELADLMMVAHGEVEDAICRLAQLARAAGIHLVLATQRPSVDVITGLIKANMPSRIAFSVSSGVDSRTIIDMNGAEKLLGKGDMLFYPAGYQKPARVQGAFVSDKEVQSVVDFLKSKNGESVYNEEVVNHMNSSALGRDGLAGTSSDGKDAYFVEAGKFIIEKDKASIGMLQRVFKIGFNRAARIMDQLCEAGVVGGEEGTKPRKILMSMEEFEQYIDEYI